MKCKECITYPICRNKALNELKRIKNNVYTTKEERITHAASAISYFILPPECMSDPSLEGYHSRYIIQQYDLVREYDKIEK